MFSILFPLFAPVFLDAIELPLPPWEKFKESIKRQKDGDRIYSACEELFREEPSLLLEDDKPTLRMLCQRNPPDNLKRLMLDALRSGVQGIRLDDTANQKRIAPLIYLVQALHAPREDVDMEERLWQFLHAFEAAMGEVDALRDERIHSICNDWEDSKSLLTDCEKQLLRSVVPQQVSLVMKYSWADLLKTELRFSDNPDKWRRLDAMIVIMNSFYPQ